MRCVLIFAVVALCGVAESASAQGISFRRFRGCRSSAAVVICDCNAPSCQTPVAPPAPTLGSLSTTFFAPSAGLDRADAPLPPLAPGERPITILIPLSPKELVARTLVTWGFKDAAGAFVAGGRDVFDFQGGVSAGVIPAGVDVNSLEIHARVDYVEPQFIDLEYLVTPTVGASGVNAIVQTSSNVQKQRLILRSLKSIQANDYLVAQFHTKSISGDASQDQQASAIFQPDELKHAEQSIVQKLVAIPIRNQDGAKVQWRLYGRLNGKQVSKTFEVEHRKAVEVFMDQSGALDVWLGVPSP